MKFFLILTGVLLMNQISFAKTETIFKGHAHFKIKPKYVSEFKKEVEKIIGPTLKEKAPHMIEFFSKIKVGQPGSYVESFEVSGFDVKTLN